MARYGVYRSTDRDPRCTTDSVSDGILIVLALSESEPGSVWLLQGPDNVVGTALFGEWQNTPEWVSDDA